MASRKVTIRRRTEITSTITLTCGDQAENHVGMEKVGNGLKSEGYTVEELDRLAAMLVEMDYDACNYHLSTEDLGTEDLPPASILIIKKGLFLLGCDVDKMYESLVLLDWDKKAIMRGRLVNKIARHNLCFDEDHRDSDIENGKGTIISYDEVSCMRRLHELLPVVFGDKASDLYIEGNHYYDPAKTYIGFHGDGERRVVIGLRLGLPMDLVYLWFQDSKPISDHMRFNLEHGDVYIMSEKAAGTDWKKRKIPTLRHAAGSEKYTTYKK